MATKGSKANANKEATATAEICPGHKVRTKFLVVAISQYDVILGMPFMQENQVTLNTGESTAHFGRINYTLQCSTQNPRTNSSSATTEELPNFQKMFPKLFPEKEPEGLPPLREGCNHHILLKPDATDTFGFTRRRIPQAYRNQLEQHLQNWERQGIAKRAPGHFA